MSLSVAEPFKGVPGVVPDFTSFREGALDVFAAERRKRSRTYSYGSAHKKGAQKDPSPEEMTATTSFSLAAGSQRQ